MNVPVKKGKQGDSWICAERDKPAISTSKSVIFREMVDVHENFEEICQEILQWSFLAIFFDRYCWSVDF